MKQKAKVLWHAEWLQRLASTPDVPQHCLGRYLVDGLVAVGFDVSTAAPPGSAKLIRDGVKYRKLCSYDAALVLQGYGLLAVCLARLGRKSPRVIVHTWKIPGIGGHRLRSRVMDLLLARAMKLSSLVVLNSLAQQRQMAERFPKIPTVWVPFVSDIDWFTPGPVTTDVLSRYGLEDGRFLLCVGDIDRDERLPAEVARSLDRHLVRVTRDPATADRARRQMQDIGFKQVTVLVKLPWTELRDLYRRCWALLTVPTVTFHPAGLTTLTEGMACGAPVLFPSGPTLEGHMTHEQDGLQFDATDRESIVAVARRLEDPAYRARISAGARLRCEQQLNISAGARILARAFAARGLDSSSA